MKDCHPTFTRRRRMSTKPFLPPPAAKTLRAKRAFLHFFPLFPHYIVLKQHTAAAPRIPPHRKRLQSSVSPSLTRMPPPSLLLLLFLSLSPLRYLMLLLPSLPPPPSCSRRTTAKSCVLTAPRTGCEACRTLSRAPCCRKRHNKIPESSSKIIATACNANVNILFSTQLCIVCSISAFSEI